MENIGEVDATNWNEEVGKSPVLTVIYFWHEQCPYCYRLSPILHEVANEYRERIKFVKLNILAAPGNRQVAENFGVMSTPTLMFMCGGRPIAQIIGLQTREDLEKGFNDMLLRHRTCLSQSTQLKPSYVV